jgi:hypothetical protein
MLTNVVKFNPCSTPNRFPVHFEVKDGSEIKIKCTRLDKFNHNSFIYITQNTLPSIPMTVGKVNRQVSVRRHIPNSSNFILFRNIAPIFTAFVVTSTIAEVRTMSHLCLRLWFFADIDNELFPHKTTRSYLPTQRASSKVIRGWMPVTHCFKELCGA